MTRTISQPPTSNSSPEKIDSMNIRKDVLIDAPIEVVWETLLEQIGPQDQMPDGKPFPKTLEAWPGGRWFRDLGNNTGHLWGHVQVIKPPKLLEISGPLIMSYPCINHLQWRLTAEGQSIRLSLIHRAIGPIDPEHRHVEQGWDNVLQNTRNAAQKKASQR